jgi:hypothetical protein
MGSCSQMEISVGIECVEHDQIAGALIALALTNVGIDVLCLVAS